jgi:4-oxalocrotonate tautomerase
MPLIQIHLLEGRSRDEKRRLLQAVTRAVQESIDAPLPSIRVWLQEMSPDEYMVAGELASERGKSSG